MRITNIRVENYKSFRDSGNVSLASGMNVIVGENNVGKTALLEALSLRFTGNPHRSLKVSPRQSTPPKPNSLVTVTIEPGADEVKAILHSTNAMWAFPMSSSLVRSEADERKAVVLALINQESLPFTGTYQAAEGAPATLLEDPGQTVNRLYDFSRLADGRVRFIPFQSINDRTEFEFLGEAHDGAGRDYGINILKRLSSRIYHFRAERLNVGICPAGTKDELESDARNLPEAINHLQSNNPERFNRLNRLVTSIFPSIYRVSARPYHRGGNQVELVTWTEDPVTERQDLTVPLSDSGTGVGQVLAILYVVLTAQFPRTFLIDEPNSFLHPGAARKLFHIIQELNKGNFHQFIVTTHSPEIIRAADPRTMTLVEWNRPESNVRSLDPTQLDDVQAVLAAVGVRLSDVFGADSVLWVEGQTEEECYRLLLKRQPNANVVSIVAVRSTGDFEAKKPSAKLIWEIYERLSRGVVLIPPALAFIFDRDGRSEQEVEDLARRAGGKMRFLKRRMYENYLLNPAALAAVLNGLPAFSTDPVEADDVSVWIAKHGADKKYCDQANAPNLEVSSLDWLRSVNAGRLLHDMFQDLSAGKEEYRKTRDAVKITAWLTTNAIEDLQEVLDLLTSIVGTHRGLVA